MEVKASLKNLRMSPRKVRLVTGLIKGMDVVEARTQLRFLNKKASGPIAKLLDSAIANAKNNFNIGENIGEEEKRNLYIASILVNQGNILKRWMPRAFGRTAPIMKRTSHIVLVLREKIPGARRPASKSASKKDRENELARSAAGAPVKKETEDGFLGPEKLLPVKEKKEKRTYDSSSISKKRFFSRQTFGNIKKTFRRKSV
ncbi:MAG: 50S ribosomal protein L22 [Candidatus Portnoybacteria bacterium]|nr:50S ribosomal protein L22 [Candidatus Portnoybacteria bacterium]